VALSNLEGDYIVATRSRKRVDRRHFLKVALSASAAGAVFAPYVARAQAAEIIVATSGGKLEEAFSVAYYEPFTKKTGIKIVKATTEYAKLKAMVDAGAPEWDVAQVSADQAAVFSRQKLLEPFDLSLFDKEALLPGVLFDDYVIVDLAAAVIAWNTKSVPADKAPRTWADVWNLERIKGDRAFWKQASETLEIALLADGVEPSKLYPLDVDRAFRSLDKIKKNITWWTAGAQSVQLLTSGETPVGYSWNGRLYEPRTKGAPVDFHFNQSLFVADSFLMPKGVRRKREAMQFIAFALQPENQANFSRAIPYGPVAKKALTLLDAQTLALLPSSEENFPKGTLQNGAWWAENGAKANERFNSWIIS
jgi:putative spermidine/putrescine transport system substrate-binding protein